MAGVRERHVLEESDHGVDVGPPLSIAQREFSLPRPVGYEEWVALAECTAYTGHCGRKRGAFTTLSNTVVAERPFGREPNALPTLCNLLRLKSFGSPG